MPYKTVYSIAGQPPIDRVFLGISAGLLIATFLVFLATNSPSGRYSLLAFTLLFILFTLVMPYWDHHRLVSKLSTPECKVSEGKIMGYWRKDWYQKDTHRSYSYESFRVDTVQFGYHRLVEMAGFHNAEAHHFPIQNGLIVRIYYVPERQVDDDSQVNRILKLDTVTSQTILQSTLTTVLQ
ncbi:hypothetical protein G8759_34720 [Spirosoma aureum]|uniref:Uncharacterized protein n=1 Tax=Spirosoma aureum TaxID=2692134 RepID=A0A6G9AY91_9BACT|nr:hypothetical protein [Spirosoma aureum]QIP17432.1 hypothetical protein G8759_34720 [Spirosoma aureum]